METQLCDDITIRPVEHSEWALYVESGILTRIDDGNIRDDDAI